MENNHMKIAINKCFGGFSLSVEAEKLYATKKGYEIRVIEKKHTWDRGYKILDKDGHSFWSFDCSRSDPILIEVIEELKLKANGECAEIEIIEIPDDIKYEIGEYDGIEWVAEIHRTWG